MPRAIETNKRISAAYAKRLKNERKYQTLVRDYEVERVPHPTLKNTWIERKKVLENSN
jgi:hypothetical protein